MKFLQVLNKRYPNLWERVKDHLISILKTTLAFAITDLALFTSDISLEMKENVLLITVATILIRSALKAIEQDLLPLLKSKPNAKKNS